MKPDLGSLLWIPNCLTLTYTKRCATKSRCISMRCIAHGCGQLLQQGLFIHGFRCTSRIFKLICLGTSGVSHQFFSPSVPSVTSFSGTASDGLKITSTILKKKHSAKKKSYVALGTGNANASGMLLSTLAQPFLGRF